jgi:hypothetical protein
MLGSARLWSLPNRGQSSKRTQAVGRNHEVKTRLPPHQPNVLEEPEENEEPSPVGSALLTADF